MGKKTAILALSLCLVFALTACDWFEEDEDEIGGEGVFVGNQALDFTETDTNGSTVSLSQFRGKVILLTFSTMWCEPCKREAGTLQEMYQDYREQGFDIVQVIYEDESGQPSDINDINRWKDEYGLTFTIVNDPDSSTVDNYQISAVPLNLLIDREFVIRYRNEGFNEEAMTALIEDLL